MIDTTDYVVLPLTPEQTAQLVRTAGISILEISVNRLLLKMATSIALQTQSQTLLISNSSDALLRMRAGGIEAVEAYHFVSSLELDGAQKQILAAATRRNFDSVVIIPDDHKVSYPEKWDTISFPFDVGPSLTIANAAQSADLPVGKRQTVLLETGDFGGFGTGTHATTRLCLELIQQYSPAVQRVLEVGTGSGIVAIACARLGATAVVACDVDERAVRAARRNVSLNLLDDIVQVEPGTLLEQDAQTPAQPYDLIVGNLFPAVLKPLFAEFIPRLKPTGRLIISGLVQGRERDVALAWQRAGFALVERRQHKNWMAFVLEIQQS